MLKIELEYKRVINEVVMSVDGKVPHIFGISIPRWKPRDMLWVSAMLDDEWKGTTTVIVAGSLQKHGRYFFDAFLKVCRVAREPNKEAHKKPQCVIYQGAVADTKKIETIILGYIGEDERSSVVKDSLKFYFYAYWARHEAARLAEEAEQRWLGQANDKRFLSWSKACAHYKTGDQNDSVLLDHGSDQGLLKEMVDRFYSMLKYRKGDDVTPEMEEILRLELTRFYQKESHLLEIARKSNPGLIVGYSFGRHAEQQKLFTRLGEKCGFDVYSIGTPAMSGSSSPTRGSSVPSTPGLSPNRSPTRAPSSRVPPDGFSLDNEGPRNSRLAELEGQVKILSEDLRTLTERYNQLEKAYQGGQTGEKEMLLFGANRTKESNSESATCWSVCVVS